MSAGRLVASLAFAAGLVIAFAAWLDPANVFGLMAGLTFCG